MPADFPEHLAFFLKELEVLQPKRVVALGALAHQLLRQHAPDLIGVLSKAWHFGYAGRYNKGSEFQKNLSRAIFGAHEVEPLPQSRFSRAIPSALSNAACPESRSPSSHVRMPSTALTQAVHYFQANHKQLEFQKRCLCAPDDRFAGHDLMRALRPGDVLLHYDSTLKHIFACSHVLESAADDFHHVVGSVPVTMVGSACATYHGRHATLRSLEAVRPHLLVRFEMDVKAALVTNIA